MVNSLDKETLQTNKDRNKSVVEYVSEIAEFHGLDAPVLGRSQTIGWCRVVEKEVQ